MLYCLLSFILSVFLISMPTGSRQTDKPKQAIQTEIYECCVCQSQNSIAVFVLGAQEVSDLRIYGK